MLHTPHGESLPFPHTNLCSVQTLQVCWRSAASKKKTWQQTLISAVCALQQKSKCFDVVFPNHATDLPTSSMVEKGWRTN